MRKIYLVGFLGSLVAGAILFKNFNQSSSNEKGLELIVEDSISVYDLPEPTESQKDSIRRSFERIADLQEKRFGIKHPELPKVIFRPKEDKIPKSKIGLYYTSSNEVWVKKNEDGYIAHELAHELANKLSQSLGRGTWPPKSLDGFFYKILKWWGLYDGEEGTKLVSEGIATYFERGTFRDPKVLFYAPNDSFWFHLKKQENGSHDLAYTNVERYLRETRAGEYDLGYALVRPILNKDLEEGIELLMKNPPTNKDFRDLLAYRDRILRMMEEH